MLRKMCDSSLIRWRNIFWLGSLIFFIMAFVAAIQNSAVAAYFMFALLVLSAIFFFIGLEFDDEYNHFVRVAWREMSEKEKEYYNSIYRNIS